MTDRPATDGQTKARPATERVDAVVIGGGPAGLAAATRIATETEAQVVLLDEGPRPGGRLPGQLHRDRTGQWVVGARTATDLVAAATAAGVELRSGRQVWSCEHGWRIGTDDGRTLSAPYVVLATGAAERPLPMPGWTLPGVLAVGAVQSLVNTHRVRPGRRMAVVGTDPLALAAAEELTLGGVEVIGIFLPGGHPGQHAETDPRRVLQSLSRLGSVAPTWWARLGARGLVHRPGAAVAAALYPRRGVRIGSLRLRCRERVEAIVGTDRVQAVTVRGVDARGRPTQTSRTLPVDAVCLSGGLHPQQDLASVCELVSVAELGGRVPLHAPDLRTTAPGLYVAGSVTGVEGAPVARAQGELAGTAVAAQLGAFAAPEQRVEAALTDLARVRAEADFAFLPDVATGRERLARLWKDWDRLGDDWDRLGDDGDRSRSGGSHVG